MSQSLSPSATGTDETVAGVQEQQGEEIHSTAQSNVSDQMTLVGVQRYEKISRLLPSVGYDGDDGGREQMMRFRSGGAEVKPLCLAAQRKIKGGTTIWW